MAPNAILDIGAADEAHGESGNDTIYGQLGNDVLFGEAQDDDVIGGNGVDWISSGNGEDGVIGDDGRIFTSRNGTAEPLYGLGSIPDGGLSATISTPGNIQNSVINVSGALKKTGIVDPFMLTNSGTVAGVTPSNDIIFGGLGNDAIHGGAGDDALSGAEALPSFYAKPYNPGNILRFGLARMGEFAAYDEYNPRTKIFVNPNSYEFIASTTPGAIEFILNFAEVEQDGNDVVFGDVGNDWIAGGMGRDHLYGGYGDDLPDAVSGFGVSNSSIALSTSSVLLFDTTVRTTANGTSAGIMFDYYDAINFKYAAIVAGTNQIVIGHHSKSGWAVDAAVTQTITAGTNYTLSLSLKGTTVSLLLNPSASVPGQAQAALGFVFNAVVVDGQAGLFTWSGASSFVGYAYKTDDLQFVPPNR